MSGAKRKVSAWERWGVYIGSVVVILMGVELLWGGEVSVASRAGLVYIALIFIVGEIKRVRL